MSNADRDADAANKNERWLVFKDRLAIALVVLCLLALLFMMIDGSIMNFRCSFTEFITFQCNRWFGGT